MSQDSHAVAEPLRFEMIDNDQKYRVHSKTAILSLFRSMMRSKSLITCYFDHGNRFILTTVIDVNAEQGKMVLDYGTDEESCRLALKAERLNVVGFLDQVRIQFVCEGLGKILFRQHDAVLAPLPEALLRLQKRESYRINIPISAPLKCVIPLPAGDRPRLELILQDISCGGMAVIDHRSNINFQVGDIYQDCLVPLPEIGTARVNLKVQHVSESGCGDGPRHQRARCAYVDTREAMLSLIQRYINKLELELRRKQ